MQVRENLGILNPLNKGDCTLALGSWGSWLLGLLALLHLFIWPIAMWTPHAMDSWAATGNTNHTSLTMPLLGTTAQTLALILALLMPQQHFFCGWTKESGTLETQGFNFMPRFFMKNHSFSHASLRQFFFLQEPHSH